MISATGYQKTPYMNVKHRFSLPPDHVFSLRSAALPRPSGNRTSSQVWSSRRAAPLMR
jgi:hypothetical protein